MTQSDEVIIKITKYILLANNITQLHLSGFLKSKSHSVNVPEVLVLGCYTTTD